MPFPFTDLSTVKRRPVLAVTAADSYGDFIAIPVTSRPQAEHGLAIAAHVTDGDGGLVHDREPQRFAYGADLKFIHAGFQPQPSAQRPPAA